MERNRGICAGLDPRFGRSIDELDGQGVGAMRNKQAPRPQTHPKLAPH
jgi:hypothetical protein